MARVISVFDSSFLVGDDGRAELLHQIGISRCGYYVPVPQVWRGELKNKKTSHGCIVDAEKSRLRTAKRDF